MVGVSALLEKLEGEAQHAEQMVQRAQMALEAAVRQALVAHGKVEGVKEALKATDGDQ